PVAKENAVEPIVSMIQETGQHVAKQRNALVLRTRDAGAAFVGETRDAGRDFVRFVQTETKRWRRYVKARADQIGTGVREVITPRALEKKVLTKVGVTLHAIETKVRGRIASLEGKRASKPGSARKPRSVASAKKRLNGSKSPV